MNIFYTIRNWFSNLWRRFFWIKPRRPQKTLLSHLSMPAYERGKEDKHTKIKRKMAEKSRRINRLYAQRKGG